MSYSTYIYRESFYHKIDVRAKLVFTLLLSLASIITSSLLKVSLLAFFLMILSFFSVGKRESFNNFKRIRLIVFFILVFAPLQNRSGDALLSINSFMVLSAEGLYNTLLTLFKFVSVSFLFSLLLETERLESIISAILYFHLPYSFSLTFSMTLSFIPRLAARYSEIKDAIALRENNESKRDGLIAILTSLIVSAIKMIPETASSLEERGFDGKIKTRYRVLSMDAKIFTEIVLSVIIPIIFIIGR